MTLKTEVEVGASGYSVTGGGDQGIFVKQVLKDSSAAKLFNLREGAMTVPSLGFPVVPIRMGGTWRGMGATSGAQDDPLRLLSCVQAGATRRAAFSHL